MRECVFSSGGPGAIRLADEATGATTEVNASGLLEYLETEHEQGVCLDKLVVPSTPPLPLTANMWDSSLIQDNPEAHKFEALYSQWTSAHEQHLVCKQSLLNNKDLFFRLLAFLSDLVDYKDSKEAEGRVNYFLPTATGLFESPLYFTKEESLWLNSFVSPNGRTVLETAASKWEATPYLEGVCTAHVVVPLLKRLFSLDDESSSSKEFKEFRRAFNKGTCNKLQERNKELKDFFATSMPNSHQNKQQNKQQNKKDNKQQNKKDNKQQNKKDNKQQNKQQNKNNKQQHHNKNKTDKKQPMSHK